MNVILIGGIIILCVLSTYLGFLTIKGSIAAFITGLLIFLSFQWQGIIILGLFYLTSSFLTKWKKDRKRDSKASDEEDKRGRTSGQVFANGGVALLAAIGDLYYPDPIWLIIFTSSFATATADTWASEIGTLAKEKPFHLKEWKKVEKGLSGAVSPLGTIAAIIGASVIGGCFYLLYQPLSIHLLLVIILAGFLGNVADTLFGAWSEQKFYCPICKTETESRLHCGNHTVRIFGYSWFTNNMVNFLSTLIGGCIGGGLYIWL